MAVESLKSAVAAHAPEAVDRAVDQWLVHWQTLTTGSAARCYVGFSGGMDSTVLLHALAQRIAPPALQALHLDHGVQVQSRQWRAHCQAVCAALAVPLITERLPALSLTVAGSSLEAQARSARYEFFSRQIRAAQDVLVLAHHAEDQAETLLLRLLQGRGLLPMPAHRPVGAGVLWRPMLSLPRAVLANYAARHELRWIEDPSNQSLDMDRNYVRHRLWPAVIERWPGAARHLSRVADTAVHTETALARVLSGQRTVPVAWCQGAAGVAVLRFWLGTLGEFTATDRALAEFVRQLPAPPDRHPRLCLTSGQLVRRKAEVCYEPLD